MVIKNYFYIIKIFLKKGSGKIFIKNLLNKISFNYVLMIFNILKFKILFNNNFLNYYDIYIIIKPNIYKIIGLSFGLKLFCNLIFFFFKKKLKYNNFIIGIISYNYNIIPVNNILYKAFIKNNTKNICILSKNNILFKNKLIKNLFLIKINNLFEIIYLIKGI